MVRFDRASTIYFQLFGKQRRMSYTKFSLLTGLYDTDYSSIPKYEQLLIDFPFGVTPGGSWKHLSWGQSYKTSFTKASFLTRAAVKYVHTVIT